MIKYYKLFDLLNRRNMKKTDLLEIVSSPTLAKLSKGGIIKTDVIDRICEFLQCQPADIMEYIENDKDKGNSPESITREKAKENFKETRANRKESGFIETMKKSFKDGFDYGNADK